MGSCRETGALAHAFVGEVAIGVGAWLVVIGGIIPDVDIPKLQSAGVKGIFLPGTPMQQIIDFIRGHVRARAEDAHERARVELSWCIPSCCSLTTA